MHLNQKKTSIYQRKKKPNITQGAYFLMSTRRLNGKEGGNCRINPRWVAFWITVVFYKLLLKLKKKWVHIPARNSTFATAPENL